MHFRRQMVLSFRELRFGSAGVADIALEKHTRRGGIVPPAY